MLEDVIGLWGASIRGRPGDGWSRFKGGAAAYLGGNLLHDGLLFGRRLFEEAGVNFYVSDAIDFDGWNGDFLGIGEASRACGHRWSGGAFGLLIEQRCDASGRQTRADANSG